MIGQSKVTGRPASNARVEGGWMRDKVGGEQEREVSMEEEGAAMIRPSGNIHCRLLKMESGSS